MALLAGAVLYIYDKGKEAGKADGQRAQLELDRKQFEQDRQQFIAQLNQYKADEEAARAVIQAKDQQLAALQASRVTNRQVIAKLADADLGKDIHQRLGNPPTDMPFTIPEMREIDTRLADYDGALKQVQLLSDKMSAMDQRLSAVEKQRDASIDAYNKLVPLYEKAYNAAQVHHSKFVKIITLGLVRDRKLDLPTPVSLVHP